MSLYMLCHWFCLVMLMLLKGHSSGMQHGSAGHHFSRITAVTIELTEWQNHIGKVWWKSQCSFHFTGMTVKVFIILWMFTLLKRIHNLQWQLLFLHQIVPTPLLPITFKCSKLQSLPTRDGGGGLGFRFRFLSSWPQLRIRNGFEEF